MAQTMSNSLFDISLDLIECEPEDITIPSFTYNEEDSEERIFEKIYRALQSSARLKRRISLLYLAYQMGHFLEEKVQSRIYRMIYKSQLTAHFYIGSIRTYYIFRGNISQIFRTKTTTFQMIRHLRAPETGVENFNYFRGRK